MEGRKFRVLITAAVALVLLGSASLYHEMTLPEPVALDTKGLPSIGAGEIELVVFEDFRCVNCRIFSEEILPQISARYIETGRARCIIVPVAFLKGSKPLANAALAVYHQAPGRFPAFAHELFSMKSVERDGILEAAVKVGGIDLDKLTQAIDKRLYYDELDSNLNWARRLMGKQFGTPALYVNGIPTSTASFDAVTVRVEQIERKK